MNFTSVFGNGGQVKCFYFDRGVASLGCVEGFFPRSIMIRGAGNRGCGGFGYGRGAFHFIYVRQSIMRRAITMTICRGIGQVSGRRLIRGQQVGTMKIMRGAQWPRGA